MEDFISADPCQFDHASMFKILQNLTLEYRLSDPYCSLVRRTVNLYCKERFKPIFFRVGLALVKFSY